MQVDLLRGEMDGNSSRFGRKPIQEKAMRKVVMLWVVVLFLGLAGCAYQASSGREITQEALSQVVLGQTTKAEMITLFGPPVGQGYSTDGRLVLTWQYFTNEYSIMSFMPKTRLQMLSAVFDANEILERYNLGDNSDAGPRWGK